MSKHLNEELVKTYVLDFKDFTEELPNDLSPMISKLFELDSKLIKNINKIEHKLFRITNSKKYEHQMVNKQKIERYLTKIKTISLNKVEISSKIFKLIEIRGKELTENYEGILLCNQTESFTYGTRSGRMWTTNDHN